MKEDRAGGNPWIKSFFFSVRVWVSGVKRNNKSTGAWKEEHNW